MKFSKNILFVLLFFVPIFTNAQSDEVTLKNEFGTDIITLVQQVFNFGQGESYQPYSPTYVATYKRHFKHLSTRIAIGGRSTSSEIDNDLTDEDLRNVFQQLDYRIGVEKSTSLYKRWNFYYGIDFKHSILSNQNDGNYSSNGERWSYERTSSSVGLSPFFGIEFQINERIVLQTEVNFIAYLSNTTQNQTIISATPNPSGSSPLPRLEDNSGFGTAFNVPNFLILAVRL